MIGLLTEVSFLHYIWHWDPLNPGWGVYGKKSDRSDQSCPYVNCIPMYRSGIVV